MLGIAFGTRPEWLKIKPVVEELKERGLPFGLIFTGQHVDLLGQTGCTEMIEHVWHMPEGFLSNRLDSIVSQILESAEDLDNFSQIMVQGDTGSAFATALAAFHRKIPVIHLEAGLRTWNLEQPYPEEGYRQMISCIASLHLCPTLHARASLVNEGARLLHSTAIETGNTVLDNIRDVKTTKEKKVLVTMHRRENHERMGEWFKEIDLLAGSGVMINHEFLLPIHPNPEVSKYRDTFENVKVVDPLSHDKLINYLASCDFVITDSGGIQEEAAFLRKPCIVCRRQTERGEGLGNFSILARTPEQLWIRFMEMQKLPLSGPCPYGDGYAAKKVVDAIEERF